MTSKREKNTLKEILIYVNYINTNDTKSLIVGMNKTVKELKKEIEVLFNLSYSLDEIFLRVKRPGMLTGKLIFEEDKTLFENHFKPECLVVFGKEKLRG